MHSIVRPFARAFLLCAAAVAGASDLSVARADGESVNGFPTWAERVLHEWTNRARCAPQLEMSACGGNCSEGGCYAPMPPLVWNLALNRSARFHCDEMTHQRYFAHDLQCTVAPNINSTHPTSCDGSASCACARSAPMNTFVRIALFGVTGTGEAFATGADPNQTFYLWLFEPSTIPVCGYNTQNGHRFLLLSSVSSMGAGVSSFGGLQRSGADSSAISPATGRIPSGSHYPRQAATVQAWANWFDTSAPLDSFVVVDGNWLPMSLQGGTATDGAWSAAISGVGSGCHRYFFAFHVANGALVTYPTTGTLGIGPQGSCADWDPAPPLVARAFCAGDGTLATPCPCGNVGGSGRGCANSQNSSGAALAASGTTNPDSLVLQASGMTATSSFACLFLQGSQRNSSGIVLGDGLRCASGTLVRIGSSAMPTGSASYPGPGDLLVSVRGGVTRGSGVTRWYQTYYRTAATSYCTPTTFNITSGVEIRW